MAYRNELDPCVAASARRRNVMGAPSTDAASLAAAAIRPLIRRARSLSATVTALTVLLAGTGTAFSAEQEEAVIPTRNLLEVVMDGGWLMMPIIVCSFILCVFVFERLVSLRRGRVIPRPFVRRLLEQLREGTIDRDEAVARCEENKSPVAEVFLAAFRKWGRASVEVEQSVIDAGERVSQRLRRYLRLLNGVSTISPLLGLLGTVLGMIRAFNAIVVAGAMGRPELLASGISQALITTAAGLTVAIPALIAFLYFTSRVEKLIMEIDRLSQEVIGLVSADGWHATSSRSKKKAA